MKHLLCTQNGTLHLLQAQTHFSKSQMVHDSSSLFYIILSDAAR